MIGMRILAALKGDIATVSVTPAGEPVSTDQLGHIRQMSHPAGSPPSCVGRGCLPGGSPARVFSAAEMIPDGFSTPFAAGWGPDPRPHSAASADSNTTAPWETAVPVPPVSSWLSPWVPALPLWDGSEPSSLDIAQSAHPVATAVTNMGCNTGWRVVGNNALFCDGGKGQEHRAYEITVTDSKGVKVSSFAVIVPDDGPLLQTIATLSISTEGGLTTISPLDPTALVEIARPKGIGLTETFKSMAAAVSELAVRIGVMARVGDNTGGGGALVPLAAARPSRPTNGTSALDSFPYAATGNEVIDVAMAATAMMMPGLARLLWQLRRKRLRRRGAAGSGTIPEPVSPLAPDATTAPPPDTAPAVLATDATSDGASAATAGAGATPPPPTPAPSDAPPAPTPAPAPAASTPTPASAAVVAGAPAPAPPAPAPAPPAPVPAPPAPVPAPPATTTAAAPAAPTQLRKIAFPTPSTPPPNTLKEALDEACQVLRGGGSDGKGGGGGSGGTVSGKGGKALVAAAVAAAGLLGLKYAHEHGFLGGRDEADGNRHKRNRAGRGAHSARA